MNRRAFTLIELVLATAACSVILLAVYGVFSRAVKLRDNATTRIRETRVQAHAAGVIRNDLRNARISGATQGTPLAVTLEGSASGKSGSYPGYLKFTTTTAQDSLETPAGDLQRVEYYIVNDPEAADRKAGLLVRTAERDLLAAVEQTPPEEPLLAGIESMEVAFYDGSAWQESWKYEDTKTVPEAVRVRLQPGATDGAAVPPPIEVLVPWTVQPTTP